MFSKKRKEKNMAGKEELLEITYDPQGNIIGRKKADGGNSSVKYGFHDMLDYKDDDYTETIYVYGGGNVYLETMPAIEVTYELDPILEQPEQNQVLYTDYGYKITNVNPTSHSFGNRGYSLMNSSVNNIYTSSEPQYNTYDNVGFSNDTNFNFSNNYGVTTSQNNYDNYFSNNYNNDFNFSSTNDFISNAYSNQSAPVYSSYQSDSSPFATVTKLN